MKNKMRFFGLILLWSALLSAAWTPDQVPDPRARNGSHVADPNHFLNQEETQDLNDRLKGLETDTGAQFAIVILNSIDSELDVHEFGVELFEKWGLGQKDRHNGLLLLLVMNTHDWRFNTGYGLEPVLTDALLSKLGYSCIVPNFREQRYARGLNQVVDRIQSVLISDNPAQTAGFLTVYESWWTTWIISMWILWGIPFLIGLLYLFSKTPVASPADVSACRVSISGQTALVHAKETLQLPSWGNDRFTRFFSLHLLSLLVPGLAMVHNAFFFDPVFNSIVGFFCWLLLTLTVSQFKRSRTISKRTDRTFERYFFLKQANRLLGLKAFFFPLPFLFIYIFHRFHMARLKKHAFPCPICQGESLPADSQMIETLLGPVKAMEKKIGSVDHWVYRCHQGHNTEIPFPGRHRNRYTACQACGAKATRQTGSTILRDATYTSTGTGQKEFSCRYCQAVRTESFIIPIKTQSTSSSGSGGGSSGSSSSSSSSSSSGSSWGGGSTGGGGAGGKW